MTQHKKWKRSRKLIEPRIQLRFFGLFICIVSLAAMVQSIVITYFMSRVARDMPTDGMKLMEALPQALPLSFLATFLVLLPIVLAMGISSTFRIVGPLYRFRVFLRQVANGEASAPCRIRKDDELHDFCDLLNEVTAPLRGEEPAPVTPETSSTGVDEVLSPEPVG